MLELWNTLKAEISTLHLNPRSFVAYHRLARYSFQATPTTVDTKEAAIRLWAHECQRVFSDRFVQDAADDQGRFREVIGFLIAPGHAKSDGKSRDVVRTGNIFYQIEHRTSTRSHRLPGDQRTWCRERANRCPQEILSFILECKKGDSPKDTRVTTLPNTTLPILLFLMISPGFTLCYKLGDKRSAKGYILDRLGRAVLQLRG